MSLFPLITCSLRVIRDGYATTKVVALYFQPGRGGGRGPGAQTPAHRGPDPRPPGPRPPPTPLAALVWGLIRPKTLHVRGNWTSMLLLSAAASLFFTQSLVLSPGPHPLVGCYSIFKHHSAESQPPRRPARRTCNKLSSSETSETNETSRAEAGQGHLNESHLINIFIFA